jgi:phasin family protein
MQQNRADKAPQRLKELPMAYVTDQVAGVGTAQLDTALRIAEFNVSTLEKLASLQFGWSKALYGDVTNSLRRAASVRDVADLSAIAGAAWQPALERTADHAKNVYQLLSAAQAELQGIVDQQMTEVNKQVAATLDSAARSAPAGSEGAVNALKSVIHAASAVYEAGVRATRQATDAAQAGLSSAAYQAAPKTRVA